MICRWSAAALGRSQHQLLGRHLVAGPEADVPDSAERRNVLILLADGLSAAFDLDHAGPLGQLLRRYLPALVGEQRVQQADRDRGRGPEPGAC